MNLRFGRCWSIRRSRARRGVRCSLFLCRRPDIAAVERARTHRAYRAVCAAVYRDCSRAHDARIDLAVRSEFGIGADAVSDAESAARAADIIVTTTPATEPVLKADWLQPGQHVTAMGSDQHSKNEIEPAALVEASGGTVVELRRG